MTIDQLLALPIYTSTSSLPTRRVLSPSKTLSGWLNIPFERSFPLVVINQDIADLVTGYALVIRNAAIQVQTFDHHHRLDEVSRRYYLDKHHDYQ